MEMSRRTERIAIVIVFVPIFILIINRIFNSAFQNVFHNINYLSTHAAIHILSISLSFTIAIQAWMSFQYSKSRSQVCISMIFIAVSLLELLHTLSFNGMPIFTTSTTGMENLLLSEVANIGSTIALFVLFFLPDKRISFIQGRNIIFISLGFVMIILLGAMKSGIVLFHLLGSRPTQLTLLLLQLLIWLTPLTRYLREKNLHYFNLTIAIGYLFFNRLMLSFSSNNMDIYQLLAHTYSFIGYFYLLKAIYHPTFEEPIMRKQIVEKDLDQTRKELMASESKFLKANHDAQQLIDTIHQQEVVIFKFREQRGKFIHTLCGGQLLLKMGLTQQMIVGKEAHEIFPQEKAIHIQNYYQKAWLGEKVVYETRWSNDIITLTCLNPIKHSGRVIEVVGTCMDIAELKKAQMMLQQSDKLTLVGQLAAGVAHEIRNPLTSLKGFIQLMKNTSSNNGHYFHIMLEEIERINMIVSEFMILAKPNAVQLKLTDLRTTIHSVIILLNTQAILFNIHIQAKLASDLPLIMCDENHIKQVLINFIKNAIEAMPNGGNIWIEAVQAHTGQALIRITDEGGGIPESTLKRLGEPFLTTKEKGTGLGIMVSKKIIHEHQGSITFTSELHQGTTIEVLLPINIEQQLLVGDTVRCTAVI